MPNPIYNRRMVSAAGPSLNPVTTSWVSRVQANGGAKPSATTIAALDTFVTGMTTDGLDAKMLSLCVFVPDSLIAALTPIYKVAGNDPWTNHNVVQAAANGGVTLNGVNAYLQTGVNLTSALGNNNDVGYTMYGMSGSLAVPQTILFASDGNLAGNWSNNLLAMYNGWDFSGFNASINNTAVGRYILLSANRTASNAEAWYGFNSFGFQSGGTNTVAPATRPNLELYMGAWNSSGTPAQFNGSATNYSMCGIHHGLTTGQTQSFCNRLQAFLNSLGGGYS